MAADSLADSVGRTEEAFIGSSVSRDEHWWVVERHSASVAVVITVATISVSTNGERRRTKKESGVDFSLPFSRLLHTNHFP